MKKGDRIGINLVEEPAPIPVTVATDQVRFMPFADIRDVANVSLRDFHEFDYIPFGSFSTEVYINTSRFITFYLKKFKFIFLTILRPIGIQSHSME